MPPPLLGLCTGPAEGVVSTDEPRSSSGAGTSLERAVDQELTMEDEGAESDDGRPPTCLAPAPAESPARETLRPASKKPKGKKKLNELDEGEEFVVTAAPDGNVYRADSASAQMKRDPAGH